MREASYLHSMRHAPEHPVPIGGASSVEAISWLHWAPLPPDMGSCRYEACCCDKHCTCQEPLTEEAA